MSDPAPRLGRHGIAKRAARDLPDGANVNLGIGIPSLCANYLLPGVEVTYHAENGVMGFRDIYPDGEGDPNLMDAGGRFPKPVPGMSYFDSVTSFDMIRGGHIDITVLGALQVSRKGDLANWMIPKRGIGSIGGAMDLAAGAKEVIVAMEHTVKGDIPKIVDECSFPLTALGCVSEIITDIAVIEVAEDGLVLKEVAPGWNAEAVQALTEAELVVSSDLRSMA